MTIKELQKEPFGDGDNMRFSRYILCGCLLISHAFTAFEADGTPADKLTIMPQEITTLKVPLKLGFQLGMPARDNSAFYAECFSSDVLQREITRLNQKLEIGLIVKHQIDPVSATIKVELQNTAEELKGLTLRSGHLRPGKEYTARAFGVKIRGDRRVILRIKKENSNQPPVEITDKISRWRRESKLEWSFIPQQGGGHLCTFLIEPDSTIKLHGFSLLPDDAVSIWRKESIDLLKNTGAAYFRWPVVDGMNYYNWYDGIGALNGRSPVQPELTGLTHHDFGTAEYVDFCTKVGVEPLICVPLYTPVCSDPRVKDLATAAQMAADWVAYCNAGKDHPLALLRARNGARKPLRVKHWELVVPQSGALISPAMLAENCRQYIQVMKEEDSSILIGATLLGYDTATLHALLLRIGKQLDFVSCYAAGSAEIIKKFNNANGCRVMFADTIMRSSEDTRVKEIVNKLAADTKLPAEYFIKWYHSLAIAGSAVKRLELAYDGPVCLPCYAEQVLGLHHGSTQLSTDLGLISAMIGRFPAVFPLRSELLPVKESDYLMAQSAWTEDHTGVVVFVYNAEPVARRLIVDFSKLEKNFDFWSIDQLGADFSRPEKGDALPVNRHQKAGPVIKHIIECPLEAASFSRILITE